MSETAKQPRCSECLSLPGPRGHCLYHPDAELISMAEADALEQKALLQGPVQARNRLLSGVLLLCAAVAIGAGSDDLLQAARNTAFLGLLGAVFAVPIWAWRRGSALRGAPVGQAPLMVMAALSVIGWLCLMASVAFFHRMVRELEHPEVIFWSWMSIPVLLWISALGRWGWSRQQRP